jgi:hypothetical protein
MTRRGSFLSRRVISRSGSPLVGRQTGRQLLAKEGLPPVGVRSAVADRRPTHPHPAGGGIEHRGSCCIDSDRPAGSLEGPRGSPRITLSLDAVRPPRPIAVSPNTMSDTRFPAVIDTLGFVDS